MYQGNDVFGGVSTMHNYVVIISGEIRFIEDSHR